MGVMDDGCGESMELTKDVSLIGLGGEIMV